MSTAAIIEKIKKLRALSQSSNAHEAAAAAGAAARLIEEHNIAEAEIALATGAADEPMEREVVYSYRRDVAWRVRLSTVLARHHACREIIKGSSYSPEGLRLMVIGRKSDVALLRYLFTWLSTEVQRLTAASGARGRKGKSSFALGCVEGIAEQLGAARASSEAKARADGHGAALVHLDGRKAAVDAYVDQVLPDLKTARSVARGGHIDPESRAAGRTAGRNIHLGAAIAGSSAKALGSGG